MPESESAVSRSVLLGTVPVLAPAPPRSPNRSMSTTLAPRDAAVVAPTIPAGPAPITARSQTFCVVINVFTFLCVGQSDSEPLRDGFRCIGKLRKRKTFVVPTMDSALEYPNVLNAYS